MYQTKTVNIKTRLFFRYRFLISGLTLSVINGDCLIKIGLVKTCDILQIPNLNEIEISHKGISKIMLMKKIMIA